MVLADAPEAQRSARDELQHLILAALCGACLEPDELPERFAHAQRVLKDEYFDGRPKGIWTILGAFYAMTGARPTGFDFDQMLARNKALSTPAKAAYSQLFAELAGQDIPLAQFRFACHRLAERWRDDLWTQTLLTVARIHAGSQTIDGKRVLSGYDDSLVYLHEQLAVLEQAGPEAMVDGDINQEGAQFLRAYLTAKHGGSIAGILSGFAPLDTITHGLQPGELALIAGYAGEGKSKTAYNWAYHAAYQQQRNVIFGAVEVSREQVRRNFIVRHSHDPKFGLPQGIDYNRLRWAQLGPAEEQVLKAVVADMRDPAQGYGRVEVFSVPHKATMSYIADAYRRYNKRYHVDLIVVDYLGLMSSAGKRGNRREELDDTIMAAKRLATDADNGNGVALLSPWQVNRERWKEAQSLGEYTKASLADTSQAERSADLILTVLRPQEGANQLQAKVIKYRDGHEGGSFVLNTDFATSLVTAGDAATDDFLRSV